MIDASARSEARVIVGDDAFARKFDRLPFAFGHTLASDPLFAPENVLALARQMAKNSHDIYYDAGDVRVDQRWDATPVCDVPIDELMHRIEFSGAWIVLRSAEKNPAFAELLKRCMQEIEQLSGHDLTKIAKLRNAIVFVSSPRRISAYHIDRECNFLLQIRGTKTLSVFDRGDREVLPESELERFWTVDNNSALYKPHLQERANVFELTPGCGVHIPVNAPHWVQNGPDVSVSLSVNFHFHDAILADIYRANYWLRRAGLNPASPGTSQLGDALKSTLFRSARALRSATRRMGARS